VVWEAIKGTRRFNFLQQSTVSVAPVDADELMRAPKPTRLKLARKILINAVIAEVTTVTLNLHAQAAGVEVVVAGSMRFGLSGERRHPQRGKH
jgi:hypothetical protein